MLQLRVRNRIRTFIFICHFFLITGVNAQRPIGAVGLVVDKQKNAITKATVCFRGRRYGDVVPCGISGNKGQFQVNDFILEKYAWLVITEAGPDNLTRGVDESDIRQFPEFRGLKLKVPKDPKFLYQLGYIKPHITYRKVELDLTKLFANDLGLDTYVLKYSVEYKKKLVVNDVYVDKRAFDYATKTIKMAFPTGDWKLTISLEGNNRKQVKEFPLSLR